MLSMKHKQSSIAASLMKKGNSNRMLGDSLINKNSKGKMLKSNDSWNRVKTNEIIAEDLDEDFPDHDSSDYNQSESARGSENDRAKFPPSR